MNFEPQKFFIGIIDFFSILLPGALLTFLMQDNLGPYLLGERYYNLVGTKGWLAFLFTSYLLGHIIFMLGSLVLDDFVYDGIRNGAYEKQIKNLANGERLSCALARGLAACFFKEVSIQALSQAVRIKEYYLGPHNTSSAINGFQWCKARLALEHPEVLVTVQRFEADSKFFRSLVIVICVLIPWELFHFRTAIPLVSLLLLILAFWRYMDQRVKTKNHAYWYIITLEGSQSAPLKRESQPQAGGVSHAGGVVFRQIDGEVKYLLVQVKKNPNEWVLPKGHIEYGERPEETAVREVSEETGVWARIKEPLDIVRYTVAEEFVTVQYYLMEFAKKRKSSDRRKSEWLSFNETLKKATHDETKKLLRLAEEKRGAKSPVRA